MDVADHLLPTDRPVRLLEAGGEPVPGEALPALAHRIALYRAMALGRRFDRQATALAKQGRLAVYPSSAGQEACQVGAAMALAAQDWLFPTYRDSVALVARGVDPVEVLSLLRGDRHCGYDPHRVRVAPQCTPLATQCPHAVGLAHAARLAGDPVVALALLGEGASSEGDFAEALNLAGVLRAPVVFLIQNNQYAISTPRDRQSAAPTFAHRGVGAGVPGRLVDGNDVLAVSREVTAAVDRARGGGGPTLIEAVTYRMEPHTNADDAGRYRSGGEVEAWRGRDPVARLEAHLGAAGALDQPLRDAIAAEAENLAAQLRTRMNDRPAPDPMTLFRHVYAEPTSQLSRQAALLREELRERSAGE